MCFMNHLPNAVGLGTLELHLLLLTQTLHNVSYDVMSLF